MGIEWTSPPSTAVPAMVITYQDRVRRALFLLAASYAPRIEEWMKQNAPWEDVTGNARQKLYADVFELAFSVGLFIGHGVDYGKFLEHSNTGRYAIVTPALDYWTPKIWQDVKRILK